MNKTTAIDARLVQSVTRAFDVLFAIAEIDHPPSARTVAEKLDLPRSTVHRLLNTLEASGVVNRIGADRGYALTPKLALAATLDGGGATLGAIAEPYLHRLVTISEETAALHVRTGDHRTCVAEVQGLRGIRWLRGRGWSAPLWSGAVGRVLMAGMSDGELDALLGRDERRPLGRNSVTDGVDVHRLVADARRRGWSSSESETVDGAAAVAAPVTDHDGATIGALSLYAPDDRLDHMMTVIDELKNAARDLGRHWTAMSTAQPGAALAPTGFHGRLAAN